MLIQYCKQQIPNSIGLELHVKLGHVILLSIIAPHVMTYELPTHYTFHSIHLDLALKALITVETPRFEGNTGHPSHFVEAFSSQKSFWSFRRVTTPRLW